MWQAARCQTARLSFEPVRDRRHIPVSNKASLGILLSAASTDLLVQTSRGDRKAVANHILFRRVFVIHGGKSGDVVDAAEERGHRQL
jgi:hypothetical protein